MLQLAPSVKVWWCAKFDAQTCPGTTILLDTQAKRPGAMSRVTYPANLVP